MMLASPFATAQVVQRSFVNSSFEVPYIDTANTGCHRTLPAVWLPGWASTENASLATGFNINCPDTGTFVPPVNWDGVTPTQGGTPPYPIPVGSQTQNMIQVFHNTLGGVSAVQGTQWAELNADSNARLYQQVCMAPGEGVTWSLSHRARINDGNSNNDGGRPEVMEFNIGPNADGSGSALIVRGSSVTNGSQGTIPVTEPELARVCPLLVGGSLATCNVSVDSATGWVTYDGSFTWNASGLQTIGFQAIRGSGNSTNAGNYLDNIQVRLKPFLQFTSPTTTYTEGGTQPTVGVQIVGVVTSSFTITLNVAGTASGSGSDYTLSNPTITIPAADYGAGQIINVPLTFNDDTVIENNETVILTIPASTLLSPYVLANTTACGGSVNNQLTATIVDNDIDLRTTKTVNTATPLYGTGNNFTYTVAYTNHTAPTTVGPTTSHNVTAAISDPVPSGLTFVRWTCAATGTAGTACPAASADPGVPISGNAVLPAGGHDYLYGDGGLGRPHVCSNPEHLQHHHTHRVH